MDGGASWQKTTAAVDNIRNNCILMKICTIGLKQITCYALISLEYNYFQYRRSTVGTCQRLVHVTSFRVWLVSSNVGMEERDYEVNM